MAMEGMKKLPFSMEAEQCTLGALILKPNECIEVVGGFLEPGDFYVEEHRLVYEAITSMYARSLPIDTVTLVNALVENGKYDQAGGKQYIMEMAQMVPSISNVRDYAKIVHEKALLRRLIEASEEVSAMAYAEEGEVPDIVDGAEQKFFEIAQNRDYREFRHIRDVVSGAYQGFIELANHAVPKGIKTEFADLDQYLVELGRGDFVLVGARPGMGKTAFALNLATNVAASSQKTVCIFSLEMSAEQLVNRMMASEALVDSQKLRTGELSDEDWKKLAHAAAKLSQMDILIDDTSSINPVQMKAKLRRVGNKLGMVVIDYLGLMQSGRKLDNRVNEVSEITRNIKIMAKDLGVPVICCAQLSRGPEGRVDKRPQLSDLRESGSIEQDADMVLFLYRNSYYESKDETTPVDQINIAEVIVAKNRHGSVGTVKMKWIPQHTKFCDLAPSEREQQSEF